MYYLFTIELLGTKAPNNVLVKSLFSDYECMLSEKEFLNIFNITKRYLSRELGNFFYCIFDTGCNILSYLCPNIYNEYGLRGCSHVELDKFDLSSKFYKWLVRYITDSDKAIASIAAVDKFICDLESGASPVSLWSTYCWYRVFGSMPINFKESDLNITATI